MRGRKPKPTVIKLLEGTRSDRVNHQEPVLPPTTENLAPPAYFLADHLRGMEFALDHWRELAPLLSKAGLLTKGDLPAFELLCVAYAASRLDPLDTKARESYRRLLIEFGLTPSSRSRIKSTVEKPKDALASFMLRKK